MCSASAMAQSSIKIYAYQTTSFWGKVDDNPVFWSFYKVDVKNKTIQYQEFETVTEEGVAPDFSQPLDLFKGTPSYSFEIINDEKIKKPRVKRNKRKWYNLATPQPEKGTPAEVYFINGETFRKRGSKNEHQLNKDLTDIYNAPKNAK